MERTLVEALGFGFGRVARTAIALAVLAAAATTGFAQEAREKSRVAVRDIVATPAVREQAKTDGVLNCLDQILQAADDQFINSLSSTRKFDIVARTDLKQVLKEQDLAESGLVNSMDPQAAKSLSLAGCRYLTTVTIDNFQDVTKRADLQGQFGPEAGEKRTIQYQAVVKIYDTTTSVLLRSTSLQFSRDATDRVISGQRQEGRKTNLLVAEASRILARDASNAIIDMIYPAKVIAYTGDQVTFNRSAETGVERGQVWEVMHAGETLVDPDTGEVLGQEETSIGWVEVTDTTANFSKARVIQDRGIQRGDILRFRPSGLPSEIGRTGPQPPRSEQGAGPTRAPGAPPPRAPAGSGGAPTPPQRDPGAGPAERGAAEELGAPLKAAIFVKNRAHTDRPTTTNPGVDDSKVMVLEDYLVDTLTSAGLQVIAREDVITAVSQFASEGANAGTNEPGADRLDRILSDSTSAKALAATLGADALVLASITSLTRDSQRFGDPSIGVESSVTTWSLDVTYRIVDGATGASQDAGTATSQEPVRQSPNLQNDTDPTDRLLRENAGKVGQSVRRALERNRVRPSTAAAETGIEIRVSMADMTIPEISKDPQSGEYVVGAARYQLEATAVSVLVDGMLVGTAPGTFQIGPGVHRIRLERALFEPVEQIVNVRAETTLNLAMKLTVEGLERWRAQGLVLEELKDKQVLRDVALERAKAMAEFLRQSHIRIDTRNVRTLVTGTNFLWPVGR